MSDLSRLAFDSIRASGRTSIPGFTGKLVKQNICDILRRLHIVSKLGSCPYTSNLASLISQKLLYHMTTYKLCYKWLIFETIQFHQLTSYMYLSIKLTYWLNWSWTPLDAPIYSISAAKHLSLQLVIAS